MSTIAGAIGSAGFGAFACMLRTSRFAELIESGWGVHGVDGVLWPRQPEAAQ